MNEHDQASNQALIVIGGGGHAKVLVGTLLLLGRTVLGFVDVNSSAPALLGVANLGDDDAVFAYPPEQVRLVNGIGTIGSTSRRQRIFERFSGKQYRFETVLHPAAVIARDVEIGSGAQVMAGAVIQPGSWLGENSIVNTGACIDHDCRIGAHAHIAPGATLSGDVHIGEGAHVGTGATIIQRIKVGAASIVGAGAVVLQDVPDAVTVVGTPAKLLTRPKG